MHTRLCRSLVMLAQMPPVSCVGHASEGTLSLSHTHTSPSPLPFSLTFLYFVHIFTARGKIVVLGSAVTQIFVRFRIWGSTEIWGSTHVFCNRRVLNSQKTSLLYYSDVKKCCSWSTPVFVCCVWVFDFEVSRFARTNVFSQYLRGF